MALVLCFFAYLYFVRSCANGKYKVFCWIFNHSLTCMAVPATSDSLAKQAVGRDVGGEMVVWVDQEVFVAVENWVFEYWLLTGFEVEIDCCSI